MARYVAFLRGVSPMNCKMAELRKALEAAGFTNVKTVRSSGNAVFDTRSASLEAIARKCEKAMEDGLGRSFHTLVRAQSHLQKLVARRPFEKHALKPKSKLLVTFLPATSDAKPVSRDGVHILEVGASEVLSAYAAEDMKGPESLMLLERTFGKTITSRTLETVAKCADA